MTFLRLNCMLQNAILVRHYLIDLSETYGIFYFGNRGDGRTFGME